MDCSVTSDRSRMMGCGAVIFQHNYLPVAPPMKNLKQVWIFTSPESPYYTKRTALMPKWRHVFDWSMSYRRDSDVFLGYGLIIPRKTPLMRDYDLVFSEKKGELHVCGLGKKVHVCGKVKETYQGGYIWEMWWSLWTIQGFLETTPVIKRYHMTISSTFRFLRTRCVLTALQRNCITFMSWIFLS